MKSYFMLQVHLTYYLLQYKFYISYLVLYPGTSCSCMDELALFSLVEQIRYWNFHTTSQRSKEKYALCRYFTLGVVGMNYLMSSSTGDLLLMHQLVFRIYNQSKGVPDFSIHSGSPISKNFGDKEIS